MKLDMKAVTQLLQELAQCAGGMVNGNRLAARAQELLDGPPGGARVWHLFHVEGDVGNDVDGDQPVSFLVSAESGSRDLAVGLARAAVEDLLPEGSTVDAPRFICACDADVFVQVSGDAYFEAGERALVGLTDYGPPDRAAPG